MSMKTHIIALAIMALTAFSCGDLIGGDDQGDNTYKSLDLTTKSAEFVQKGNVFAFDFIERINAVTDKDYIISPLSMQFLLGMILDGAKGETAEQICNVLGYGEGETQAVNEFCLSMLEQLPALDKKTTLAIADAIFVDDGWPLKKTYKDDVAKYYKAEVSNLDFANGKASLDVINGWCNKKTNGMIPKVLEEVTTDVLAYLLNAVYFKSEWSSPFQKGLTSEDKFRDESGNGSKVMMMRKETELRYSDNKLYQLVRLPYGNEAFAMYVFLPTEGHTVADVAKSLNKDYGMGMSTCLVDLWLPKFETNYHIKLNDILSEMGMPNSFDGSKADFTGMSEYALCLSYVNQDAAIKVDEEGTEAAAVSSAAMMKNTSIGFDRIVDFHADHPFLYLITESSTGAVLFAGRYSGKK